MWAGHFFILGLNFFYYKTPGLDKMTFRALSSCKAVWSHPGLGHVLEEVLCVPCKSLSCWPVIKSDHRSSSHPLVHPNAFSWPSFQASELLFHTTPWLIPWVASGLLLKHGYLLQILIHFSLPQHAGREQFLSFFEGSLRSWDWVLAKWDLGENQACPARPDLQKPVQPSSPLCSCYGEPRVIYWLAGSSTSYPKVGRSGDTQDILQ